MSAMLAALCCHNKVITLSPYDVMRLARSVACLDARGDRAVYDSA